MLLTGFVTPVSRARKVLTRGRRSQGYEVSVLQRVPRVILPPPAPLGNRPSIAPVIDPYTNEPTGAIQAKVVVPPPKRKSVGGSAIGNGGSGLQGADGEKEERAFKEQVRPILSVSPVMN